MSCCNCVIYSDLDGTFLDSRTYSYSQSRPALDLALSAGCGVVFCSSKTAAEIRMLLSDLGVAIPFISENGGGLSVPQRWLSGPCPSLRGQAPWSSIALGTSYAKLVRALSEIARAIGIGIRGFSEMSAEEIAATCRLGLKQAALAKQRQFDEPFLILEGWPAAVAGLEQQLAGRGLCLTRGGRFYHVTGRHNKGTAMRMLGNLIRSRYGEIRTVGIGDGVNDLPMLAEVDLPLLVQRADGRHEQAVLDQLPRVVRVPEAGPKAWAMAVTRLVSGCRAATEQEEVSR